MHEVVANPIPHRLSSTDPIEYEWVRGQLLHVHLDPGAQKVAVRRRLARVEQEQQLDGLAGPAQLVRDFEREKAPNEYPARR